MDRRSLALAVAVAVSITLGAITAQPNTAQPSDQMTGQANKSQPPQAPERADTSERPRAANGGQPDSATRDQQAPPQSTITVVIPDKSAAQLKADAEQRQREIAIQEEIGTFTGWLVVVGFAQVLVVLFGFIWTRRAANAAKKSAEVAERGLVRLNRAYVMTDSWTLKAHQGTVSDALIIDVSFKVKNPSRTAARIEWVELIDGPETITREVRTMIAPEEFYPLTMTHSIEAQELPPMNGYGATADVTFNVSGRIAYADIFRKTRHRRFARTIVYNRGSGRSDIIVPTFAGVNDEEEWDQD